MNIFNYYLKLISKKEEKGFTLIELLVVIIFIGVISVIALPNFTKQIGKAKESESQIIIGAINRSQQAYYYENDTFADEYILLGLGFRQNYHNFQLGTVTVNGTEVRHQITAQVDEVNGVRNFALGVFFDNGQYSAVQCQGYDIGQAVSVQANRTCSNNGIQIY